MSLACGYIVETIRKFHIIDNDLVPSKAMILSSIVNASISKSTNCHADRRKAVINKSFIKDHFSYLRWAGFHIETSNNIVCLISFK